MAVNVTEDPAAEHMDVDEALSETVGIKVGLTTTFAVTGVPEQVLAVGVIVNVTVIGALVVLVKLPEMLPLPLAAMPVTPAVLSLVQLYAAPTTFPEITIVLIALPEHIV